MIINIPALLIALALLAGVHSARSQNTAIPSSEIAATNSPPSGMALIPAGSFTMGDNLDGASDAIPTNVYVSAFYMDVNLVSSNQWAAVYAYATSHGYGFAHAGSGKAANHPVQTVDWFDCVKWCNARSQQAGLTAVYYTDTNLTQVYTNGEIAAVHPNWAASGYRLPTGAEWEKAARGGLRGQRFPSGKTISESQANYLSYWAGVVPFFSYDVSTYSDFNTNFNNNGYPYTSPVGSFAANGYGLYDMAGNVWEWCWDWYAGTPYPPGSPYLGGSDPRGPASSHYGVRVLRGGSWDNTGYAARCAYPDHFYPDNASDYIGFRCVSGH